MTSFQAAGEFWLPAERGRACPNGVKGEKDGERRRDLKERVTVHYPVSPRGCFFAGVLGANTSGTGSVRRSRAAAEKACGTPGELRGNLGEHLWRGPRGGESLNLYSARYCFSPTSCPWCQLLKMAWIINPQQTVCL